MNADDVIPQGQGQGISADFVWNYFRDVDTLEPEQVTKHYTETGTFRFGNQEPARGKAAIRKMLEEFYDGINGMEHRNTGLWLGDKSAVFEAEVTFTRKDGSKVTVPAASVLRLEGELVQDFRMIMDVAPLQAESDGAS